MSRNELGRETSPYLLQHRDQPVHWRAWDGALAAAREADRPVLLSIGYAACHWCHVMARESFDDGATAGAINAEFVAVKIDREERPDLDALYQRAALHLGGRGGWPLTVFLTPDGTPFWAGTYLPPEPRWGLPAFREVLHGVATEYRERRGEVASRAGEIAARLRAPAPAGSGIDAVLLDRMARKTLPLLDPLHGGLRRPPKFPNVPLLEMLWRAWSRTGDPAFRAPILRSLDAMAQGGLHDHLGGGFARYCVDAAWRVPHFEKMLYDNALLLDLYAAVWRETGAPLYRRRIEETAEWLLREMALPGGAFAASLAAETEGEEGRFHIWTEAEIDAALGGESAFFKEHYDVGPHGNWEGKTILHRLRRPLWAGDEAEARLANARRVLFSVRARRTGPERDDKVLADGNGLAAAALVRAALALERPDWLEAARRAWAFVSGTLGSGGTLAHSWRGGRSHPGTIDDYAAMSRAALLLHEATGEPAYLARAREWVATLDARFAAPDGGYHLTDRETESPVVRLHTAADGAAPSGNGLMAEVLARLHLLTDDDAYRRRGDALATAFSGALDDEFLSMAGLLNGADFALRAVRVEIAGDPSAPEARALRGAALNSPPLNRVVAAGPAGEAVAVVCEGQACSLPFRDPDALRTRLGNGPGL